MPVETLGSLVDGVLRSVLSPAGLAVGSAFFLFSLVLRVRRARLLRSRHRVGATGERRVSAALRAEGFAVLDDVLVPNGTGGVTQIDHVVAAGRTLLSIETKTFAGTVFARDGDATWTQVTATGKRTHHSPILQNARHCEALRRIVGVDVEGLVVMAGGAKFPKGVPTGVVPFRDLVPEILHVSGGRPAEDRVMRAFRKVRDVSRDTDTPGGRRLHGRTVQAARR